MLIRSQDGKSMVSVDGAVGLEILEIDDTQAIVCIYLSGESISIGYYQSEEKAVRVMDMIQEKYLSRMELDGGYDVVSNTYVQPNYWVLPKVFQMPVDEDVEV